jgi:integrase
VKVTPKGSKVFVYQYRLGGRGAKTKRFTIGKYGPLTVERARKQAETLALQVASGVDPQQTKKVAQRQVRELAFKPYVERFRAEFLEKKWETHKFAHSLLTSHAVPVLGDTPLTAISRRDVKAMLAPLIDKTATASNLFIVLRRLLSWAVEQEDIERSPIDGMKPPPLPKARDRVLSDEELGLVWRAAETLDYPFGPLVHLLILTGSRRDEVAALEWSELSRDAAMWTLPASRSKNDKASENPLSSAAMPLMEELAKRSGVEDRWPREGLLFSTTGKTSVSGFSRAKRRLDKAIAELALQDGLNGSVQGAL